MKNGYSMGGEGEEEEESGGEAGKGMMRSFKGRRRVGREAR